MTWWRARKAGFTNVRKITRGQSATIGAVTIEAVAGRHAGPEITYLL